MFDSDPENLRSPPYDFPTETEIELFGFTLPLILVLMRHGDTVLLHPRDRTILAGPSQPVWALSISVSLHFVLGHSHNFVNPPVAEYPGVIPTGERAVIGSVRSIAR